MIKVTTGSLIRLAETLTPTQLRSIFSTEELADAAVYIKNHGEQPLGDQRHLTLSVKFEEAVKIPSITEAYCSICKGFHQAGIVNCPGIK